MYVPIDVNLPDDDKIEQVDLAEAGLYVFACCVAKRLKSDGVVTRLKLRRYGATDAQIDRLVDVGLFTADASDAIRITAFLKHNPSADDLMDPQKMAHQRWHVKAKRPKESCPHCQAEGLVNAQVNADECATDAERNADLMPDAYADSDRDRDRDREGSSVVSPTGLGTPPPDPTDDDGKSDPHPPDLDQLARAVAQARSVRLGGGHNPGWIRAVTAGIDRHQLADIAAQHGTSPKLLDQILDGQTPTPPNPAVAAANRPRCPNPDCTDGWTIDPGGNVTQCHDCRTTP